MASVQSLKFDTAGLRLDRDEANGKVWLSEDGDRISLNFLDAKPTLPPDMQSPQQVRDFYLSMLKGKPAMLVELGRTSVGGRPAIRLILKSPQKPSGMTYFGSITIPFRDFSYVIKVECQDREMAGAVSFDRMHDAAFPQHPLSKLRKLLGRIEKTCAIKPVIRNEPPFPLPKLRWRWIVSQGINPP
jgi:hypothetical protein